MQGLQWLVSKNVDVITASDGRGVPRGIVCILLLPDLCLDVEGLRGRLGIGSEVGLGKRVIERKPLDRSLP